MPDNKHEDNTWFKKFMGMPMPGGERREKIQLWLGIIIGVALIVLAVYLTGCRAECIRACQSTMTECFDGAKTSEEREQCMTNNAACAKGCTTSGTRVHWEFRGKKPAGPMKETKPAPPKEKPSDDSNDEGFEDDE